MRRRLVLSLAAIASVVPAGPAAATTGEVMRDLTIEGTRRALAAGEVSCRELVEASLARIAAYDDRGPSLNALITVNPRAVEQAEAAPDGPLKCVPILVKDNYDTGDLPTTGSSAGLASSQPPDDATTVAKLRAAGAVVIGKANLTELALTGVTFGSLGGQTLNPYDLTRTPGGSSGGTGAGLAAGYAVAGTGSDTVNSIRSPASANSLVGLRATAGLVSRDGIIPLSSTQDVAGPIAKTVTDAAIMLDVMAGFDRKDPATRRGRGKIPRGGYARSLDAGSLRGARIGLLLPFQPDPDEATDKPVVPIMRQAVRDLEAQGATVVRVPLPDVTPDGLVEDLDVQRYEIRGVLNRYLQSFDDPVGSLAGLLATGKVDEQFVETLETAQKSSRRDAAYATRKAGIARLRARVLHVMRHKHLDALAYPQQRRLVVEVGKDQDGRNGILAALTGMPTIDVPAGFSAPTATAPIGVPVGLELTGRPFGERHLLNLAYAYEQGTKHRRLPLSTP